MLGPHTLPFSWYYGLNCRPTRSILLFYKRSGIFVFVFSLFIFPLISALNIIGIVEERKKEEKIRNFLSHTLILIYTTMV